MANKRPKKKSRKKWIFLVLLILILGLAGMYFYKKMNKKEGVAITTEKIERRTIYETVSASGRIFPEKEVNISSDVSGEVVELFVMEGDSVVAGQLLAKIDPDAYISAVERGKASVNGAKSQVANSFSQIEANKAQKEQILAQLSNANKINDRNQSLHKDGVISDVDLEASEANVATLEANLRSAEASIRSAEKSTEGAEYNVKSTEASLKELQTNLNRTTIKAPVSGIISSLSIEQGERVVGTMQMAGTEMMRIANLNSMEVQVDVSENDIVKLTLEDSVDIEVDAYLDEIFKGEISEIANSASNIGGSSVTLNTDQVTNFMVKIRIDPKSYNKYVKAGNSYPFRPGMSASVEVYTNVAEDAICVPIQSVTTEIPREKDEKEKNENDDRDIKIESDKKEKKKLDFEEIIFIHIADSVQTRTVKTGIQDDEYIQILSDIDLDLDIINGPYSAISSKLEEGTKVFIKEDEDDEKGKKK